jgi:predicted aspartyl protease
MSLSALLLATASLQAAVEVPFRLGEDAIIVDATVNNRKVSLMFDTGFSGAVVLNSSIDIGPRTGTMTLRDFVGTMEASTAKIKTLRLGQKNIDTTDMEAVLTGDRDYSFSYNTHCDGIMGFEVLQGNVVEINFERQKFIFHPNSVDITKRKPDNKKTFLTRMLPTGHNALELEVVAPSGKKLILALDTGNAFYATTHKDSLERVGLWTPGKDPKFVRSSMVASGEVAAWDLLLKDLIIFGVPVKKSVWSIIDLPSSSAESDGTVGFGFLKNFNITFDYERRRIWLDNFTGVVENEAEGDLGISAFLDPSDKRLKIFRVAPASPAEKAGIKRGDHILSIDGNENLNVSFRKLRKMFEGPKGSKVNLAISRQGNLMRFEVERDYLHNEAG